MVTKSQQVHSLLVQARNAYKDAFNLIDNPEMLSDKLGYSGFVILEGLEVLAEESFTDIDNTK